MSTYIDTDRNADDTSSSSIAMTDRKHDKAPGGYGHDLGVAENGRPGTEVGVGLDAQDGKITDAVWGTIEGDGPNYRSLSWIKACVLQLKTQIGLGILGLPAALNTLGMVPGLIAIVVIACIVGWSDYVVGTFKLNHPEVYSIADVGYILFGPIGREVLGGAFWLLMVSVAGASFLSMSVGFNTITEHATCTVVWTVVCMIIIGVLSSIQTMNRISWIGWVGLVSIMSAVITLMVAVGVADRPSLAPPGDDWAVHSPAFATPNFVDSLNAITIIIFAYGGTPNYFHIVGEMREPKDYTKSIIVGQTLMTATYLVVAAVVYHFAGEYIASPALGTAGHIVKKICYGLALPGLAAGGTMIVHTSAKYVFVRILRNSPHLSKNTPTHFVAWFGSIAVICGLGFVIAQAIPFFNDLLSLIGALLATLICIQTESYMWMWENWRAPDRGSLKWKLLMAMNMLFHITGWFFSIAGTYAAVVVINRNFQDGNLSRPFSCADNSGST